jgi:ABC-type multidrug transport system fused ATPase/permease subunit
LLDDAEIVLMDEPLSGVDAFTFLELAPTLRERLNQPGRTYVIISHRLALVSEADYIVVVEHGRVSEHGARDALLRDPESKFADLCEAARGELLA